MVNVEDIQHYTSTKDKLMADPAPSRDKQSLVAQFRTSDHWAVSIARDLIWVIAVVGSIALLLFLICGTWPAVVTIESGSMIPHMNVGDLVIVVEKDRLGQLQTWDEGKKSGYQKFGDYGDVIIYRPNGVTDFWASYGILPLSKQHPIIHRAITWVDAGQLLPLYLNKDRGQVTPQEYIPLRTSNETVSGYRVLYTGSNPPGNITPGTRDILIRMPSGNFILPFEYVVNGSGYIRYSDTLTTHGGYITKGDNNAASDQGFLPIPDAGEIEPVQKDWVIGKALFTIPYVGLLPLHIIEVIIVIIVIMVLHELYLRSREEKPKKPQKKGSKKQR
jgi:signal peptidase